MDPRREAVAEIAVRQHGLFTRRQALNSGWSRRAIGRRLSIGDWVSAEYGVYRVAGVPITWRQRLLASCLAGPAVASHRSAARLWGFSTHDDDSLVEVTAIRHKRRHAADVVWHESQRLEERFVASVDHIPVTAPNRTIVDLAVVLDIDALEETFYEALRLRWVSVEGVERMLDDLGELRRGRSRARSLLARARAQRGSPTTVMETRFLQLLRTTNLPMPVAQYDVCDSTGMLVGRVDYAYPEHQLLIELDSRRWHSIDRDKRHDREREARLRELGNSVVRVTWWELNHEPESVIDRVRVGLATFPS